jgi:hypothetical protein
LGAPVLRRIMVLDQPGQIVHEIPSPKQPEQNGLEVRLKWQSLNSNASPTERKKKPNLSLSLSLWAISVLHK